MTPLVADYDIHGIVGVRVHATSARDVGCVNDLLGAMRAPLSRDPDILIRFEEMPRGSLTVVDRGRSAYENANFFLFAQGKAVSLPFDQIGRGIKITCETGTPWIPFLAELIQLCAFTKGLVPLHASAFAHSGSGILVTGWTKGGKTEALLAFASRGAAYVGDEWILVSQDGRRLFGTPAPVVVWNWHAQQLVQLRARVSWRRKGLWNVINMFDAIQKRIGSPTLQSVSAASQRMFQKFQIRPEQMFEFPSPPFTYSFNKLILVLTHTSTKVELQPADPLEIAARMTNSVQREMVPLLEQYMAFKYAFPERSNAILASFADEHRRALARAFADKEAYILRHPYPVDLRSIYEAISHLVDANPTLAHSPKERNGTDALSNHVEF